MTREDLRKIAKDIAKGRTKEWIESDLSLSIETLIGLIESALVDAFNAGVEAAGDKAIETTSCTLANHEGCSCTALFAFQDAIRALKLKKGRGRMKRLGIIEIHADIFKAFLRLPEGCEIVGVKPPDWEIEGSHIYKIKVEYKKLRPVFDGSLIPIVGYCINEDDEFGKFDERSLDLGMMDDLGRPMKEI